jgi:hypothetical protein
MDKAKRYQELLKRKVWVEEKLDSAKKRLGHPHLDFMSAHDLAESDFNLWTAHLEEIEKEITELEKQIKK